MALVLPAVNHGLKVTLIGTNQGTVWQNSWHYIYTGADVTQAELFTLNNLILSAWQTSIAPLVNTLATLNKCNTVDLTSDQAPTAYTTLTTPTAGTRALGTAGALPTSVACVVSELVQLRYRGGHPRMYMPLGVAGDVAQGRLWASTPLAAFNSAMITYFTAIGSITSGSHTYNMNLISYYSGSHKGTEPGGRVPVLRPSPLPRPITSLTVHGRIDTQRRRLGKEAI